MKRIFAILLLLVIYFTVIPVNIFAATNYGDGTYGGGVYNVGDAPATTSDATNTSSPPSGPASSTLPPVCTKAVPVGPPDLFEIDTTKDSATLYFAPPPMPYSNFYVAYSTKPDSWQFGTQYDQGFSSGALRFTIHALSANTTYYFRVRPGNGCAPGSWGNTMKATTTSSTYPTPYYKNIVTAIVQRTQNFIANVFSVPSNTPPVQPPEAIPPAVSQQAVQKPAPAQASAPSKFCILWWCF